MFCCLYECQVPCMLVTLIIIWIMDGVLTLILKHWKASWPCLGQPPSNMVGMPKWACLMHLLLLKNKSLWCIYCFKQKSAPLRNFCFQLIVGYVLWKLNPCMFWSIPVNKKCFYTYVCCFKKLLRKEKDNSYQLT